MLRLRFLPSIIGPTRSVASVSFDKSRATVWLSSRATRTAESRHESLGFDQMVAHLGKAPDAVRHALQDLRDGGCFVTVLSIGDTPGHVAAASYWRLTDKGRKELARRGSRMPPKPRPNKDPSC